MTIDEAIDAQGDIVYGGHFRTLTKLLSGPQRDPEFAADYQAVLARMGRDLRRDGAWRAQMKLAAGWDGHKSAWAALAAFIEANRTEQPWWAILEYADGGKVGEDVVSFFATK